MLGKMCSEGGNHAFILYRLPYVVIFSDMQIENYLETFLVDLDSELLIDGGRMLGISVELGLLSLDELRKVLFINHPQINLFLSSGVQKMNDLDSGLKSIDKLLPLLKIKGGLVSMKNGSFDGWFDFSDSVISIYPGLKERLLQCINSPSSLEF